MKPPFDLTESQRASILSLRGSEAYKNLKLLLDNIAKLDMENLLASSDDHSKSFYQGTITGLRKARDIMDRLEASTKDDGRQQLELNRARKHADRISTALFGTPFWSDNGPRGPST